MSRIACAPQALACVVGIALFVVCGSQTYSQDDWTELGLEFDRSAPAPEWNSRFRSQQGWIGGDGAQSIDLGNNRTLWLYGDTWTGVIKEGRRSKARIVHNSAGIQCSPNAPCNFVVQEDDRHRPVDLIAPQDGRGWLWFQSGVMVGEHLYLFMAQFDRPSDPLRPDHQPLGTWLAVVSNPQDDPRDWCVQQTRLPFAKYTKLRDITYGCGAIVQDGYLYVYGLDDRSRRMTQERYLTLARVPVDQIFDMDEWRFLSKGRWSRSFSRPTGIADYMAGDISVAHLPELNQFLMVYTDCDVSNRIVARTAPTPAGPWSHIQTIHNCRDAKEDSKLFCYAGKAHPTLSSDGKLVVSYLTSSVDTWQVATDAKLYWPTFVTVNVRDARPPASAGTVATTEPILE